MKIEIRFNKIFKNKKQVVATVVTFLIAVFVITIFILFYIKYVPFPQPVMPLSTNSPDSVIIINDSIVPPVLYEKMPALNSMTTEERKKRFIDIMLPTILIAHEIIKQQREKVIKIRDERNESAQEDSLILKMMKKFKAKNIDDLIVRMHLNPVSLTLAQSAIESGWGTSRFCREANNLFGIWSFSKTDNRIAAGKNRGTKTIYLKKYESLLGSVIGHIHTIGSSDAFSDFREARTISQNSYRLIWFLSNYSEKRFEYIVSLRNTIEHNDLTQYDNYKLKKVDKKDKLWKKLVEEY